MVSRGAGGHGWPLACVLLAWAFYAGPLLSPATKLYLNDTYCLDLPIRVHAAQLIRGGEFPVWTSGIHCGYPLFADGQTGILYPLFLIYLISPTAEAHDVFMALHFLLMALFTYLFLASRPLMPWAAAIGAAVFMASSYHQSSHVIPGGIATVAWLPLALWLIDRGAKGDRRSYWWCALVNAVMFLAGHAHAALICYSLQLLWLMRCEGWLQIRRWLPAALVVFVLAVGICGVQLVPTRAFLAESSRSAGGWFSSGVDPEVIEQFRLRWGQLLLFVWPNAFGDPWSWSWSDEVEVSRLPWWEALIVFQGFAAVALTPLGLVWGKPRGEVAFWAAIALVALLLAGLLPAYWILGYLPLFNLFRWPTRFMILFAMAISVLSGYGAEAALGGVRRLLAQWPQPRLVATAAVVAGSLIGTVYHHFGPFCAAADFFSSASPAILSAASDNPDLRLSTMRPLYNCWAANEAQLRRNAAALPPDFNLLFHVDNAMVSDQGFTVSPHVMTDISTTENPNYLRMAGVTHLAYADPLALVDELEATYPFRAAPPPMAELELLSTDPAYFYRYKSALPRAWMVYSAVVKAEAEDRLNYIRSADFDPGREAVLETNPPAMTPPEIPPTVEWRQPRQSRLELEVKTETPGLLVVADYCWPEFEATVDGQPAQLLRANHAFRVVVVPAGSHQVVMELRPRSVYKGLVVSGVALAIWGFGYSNARRRPIPFREAGASR